MSTNTSKMPNKGALCGNFLLLKILHDQRASRSTILNALSFKCFMFVMVLWAAGTLIMSNFCTFPFVNCVQIYLGMFFLCCLSNWPVSYSWTCFLFFLLVVCINSGNVPSSKRLPNCRRAERLATNDHVILCKSQDVRKQNSLSSPRRLFIVRSPLACI